MLTHHYFRPWSARGVTRPSLRCGLARTHTNQPAAQGSGLSLCVILKPREWSKPHSKSAAFLLVQLEKLSPYYMHTLFKNN